jgi:hypothetical protein
MSGQTAANIARLNQHKPHQQNGKPNMLTLGQKLASAACILLVTGGIAAADECSTAMLNGEYDASFHTVRLGLLTGNPTTVTPFPTGQSLADGVAVYSFDGEGNFTDLNFAMRDGSPNVPAGTPGLTPDGFTSQTGTYHINPDCTGAGTMSQPNLSTTFVIVVGDRGRTFRIVGTSLHVATIPGNPDCVSGCDLAAQVTQDGEKIFGRR